MVWKFAVCELTDRLSVQIIFCQTSKQQNDFMATGGGMGDSPALETPISFQCVGCMKLTVLNLHLTYPPKALLEGFLSDSLNSIYT